MENNSRISEMKKLWDKVKKVKVAMLTTRETDGSLRSRPMYTQQTEFDDNIWFFTRDDSPKIQEITKETQVNLSYADTGDDLYVSVSGTAEVVKNREKTKELWSAPLKAWFPGGLDDPHLALIKVKADYAEYWDTKSSKMVQLFNMVKSIMDEKVFRPGENEKLNL